MTRENGPAEGQSKKTLFFVGFAITLLIALRIVNILTRSPEYDEIWTISHYVKIPVSQIFTDVATPNNHVLNSLSIKFFSAWIPNVLFAMRLPALLAFAALAVLLFRAVQRLISENAARGAVLALILLDGMVLHYAETARGYLLQTFFVFGVFYALSRFQSDGESRQVRNAVFWLVCAAGSCLSVSSGVVLVTVLTLVWGLLHVPFRSGPAKIWRAYRPLIISGVCWSVFVLAWYGANYSRFAQGRANFGETFSAAGQFLNYCFRTVWTTGMLIPLLILLVGTVWFRREKAAREFLWVLGSALLMLLSVLVTKGGPPRVYLPLVPVVFFGAGMVLDELLKHYEKLKKYGMPVFLAVLIGAVLCSEPRRLDSADPDFGTVFSELRKLEPNILTVYRPTDLYVVVNLFGHAAKADNVQRLLAPAMVLLVHDDLIGTMRFADSATGALVPGCPSVNRYEIVRNVSAWLYRLRPVQSGEDLSGKTVLCIMHGSEPELRSPDPESWLKKDFAVVNGFLTGQLRDLPPRYCFAASGSRLKADDLLRLEQDRPGRLFFRVLSN